MLSVHLKNIRLFLLSAFLMHITHYRAKKNVVNFLEIPDRAKLVEPFFFLENT